MEAIVVDPRFGKRVKERRKEVGVSLRQLAKLLGLTPAYISRIENGHENPPKAEYISRIAQILELDESELFKLVPTDMRYQRIPDEIMEGYRKSDITTKKVPEFFRTVRDSDLTEEEWDKLIESVKKRRKDQ
jgi:transcriptional regulator with XRE-family HTH domain